MTEGLAIHRLLFDGDGKAVDYEIVSVNPGFEVHTGVPVVKAQKHRGSEAVDGIPPFLEEFARVALSGKPEQMEVYYAPLQRHFAVSVFSPKKDWFVTAFSDISARKRREVENEHLNRLHAVLRHVNQTVVHAGLRDELFQQVCRVATGVGGFKMASVTMVDAEGKKLIPIGLAGDSSGFFQKIEIRADKGPKGRGPTGTAMREGRTYVCNDFAADPRTVPWRKAATEAGIAASIALPILIGGRPCAALTLYSAEIGYFQGKEVSLLEEVSDDISFALDHMEQEAELREMTRRSRILLDEVRLVALGLDADGLVTYANPYFFEVTGYTEDEVFGKSWFHHFVPQRYCPPTDTTFAELAQHEQYVHRQNGIFTKSNQERLIAWNNTVLRDRAGRFEGTMSIGEDITERKQMEENLLRAQRMESIGLLAGGVAHDLNNILSPIMMSASMLHSDLPQRTRDELVSNIEDAAQRGADIVKQILTFARGVKGERVVLNPESLINEVWGIVNETFPKTIASKLVLAKDLRNITGDKTQLYQVFLNLCVNARDAMPEGGTLVVNITNDEVTDAQLTLSADAKCGHYVKFNVTDSGTGIAPENMNRIFDPFFTTKELGNGTGLGLSTVLGIVRSHGGFLVAESKQGVGTTFEVFLPATSAAAVGASPVKPLPGRGNGETILIVDDETEILRVTETVLTRNGYLVKTATSGAEALACLAKDEGQIKLMVTDLMMPNMDGASLVRTMRELGMRLPVIASSGYGRERYQQELASLGVETFLKKPFNSRMLLNAIQQKVHLRST